MNRPPDGVDQSQRIAGGAHFEMHTVETGQILGIRYIGDGRCFGLLERVVERRLGDTDDFYIGRSLRTAESDPPPDRILAGEKLLGECCPTATLGDDISRGSMPLPNRIGICMVARRSKTQSLPMRSLGGCVTT